MEIWHHSISIRVLFSFVPRRGKPSREFAHYAFTPSLSRLEYSDSPVFTGNGRLLGLVRYSLQIEGEIGVRLLFMSMIPLKDLFDATAK
jgi:hypothetical protein